MPVHPLEPLNGLEVAMAVELLKSSSVFSTTTRIISITLREPAKSWIYGWPHGGVPDRCAEAVLFDNGTNRGSRILLNLTTFSVESVTAMPAGAQPTLSTDEQVECERAVIESPLFRDAFAAASWHRRYLAGHGRYMERGQLWQRGRPYSAPRAPLMFSAQRAWRERLCASDRGHPAVVDLNRMEVIRVEEYGKWPLPPTAADYNAGRVADFRSDIKPLLITQPDGPSFRLDGNQIAWQNWEFVIGFNAREGLTIHHLRYVDQGRGRPVLYRASLTEMVVPYGDPRPSQARKNAFDVGEYGMGMCANSLRLGCDCVGHIEYLDAHLCDSRGRALTIENAICIHEEDFGILWKHTDRRLPQAPEVRRSRRLVVSSISTVENYEYGFFWYFYQDGNIQFEIKLTGILSLGAARDGETLLHGAMVAPLLYAPNHQHFFNVRLDIGIDGPINTVQQLDVVADALDENNPYKNAFHVEATSLTTETQAKANLCLEDGQGLEVHQSGYDQ